ncbi:hypothetical protein HS7_14580 [Sulfolobales archaeon HS-7]|nr:hypothetical protein HS7_14580 [Sulfolobales archaeon HS-7]
MIFATLGSDKLITTVDAIMTEIFTGIKPNKILILSESVKVDKDLRPVLRSVGIDSDVELRMVGKGIKRWREEISSLNVDVADVTPGRKYMAMVILNYTPAEVRYAYVEREELGYKVFGYIPLNQVKVYNVRTGDEVAYEPPLTIEGLPTESKLSPIGIEAVYNLFSFIGKVDYDPKPQEHSEEEICARRGGFIRFKEEEKIGDFVNGGAYLLADTNVYVNVEERLGRLTWNKKDGRKLLASRAVYNEILNHVQSTQKDSNVKFHLAMMSYKRLHQPPITTIEKGSGDIPLIREARDLKRELPDPLILTTSDVALSNAAKSSGVETLLLRTPITSSEGSTGELIYCMSFFKDVTLTVDGEDFAIVKKNKTFEDKTSVISLKRNYNYPNMIQLLEELIEGT